MDMMNMEEQEDKLAFVKEAAGLFSVNSRCRSYTRDGIKPGALFALRFGMGEDCVVVFRIDEDFPVENFQNIIDID